MNPTCQYDSFSYGYLLWHACKISHNEHINIITCKWLTQNCLPHFVLVLKCACLTNKFAYITICVWIAMRKVNCIPVIFSSEFECQTIEEGAVTVVGSLSYIAVCVYNRAWREVRCSLELRWILILKELLHPACLEISNVEAVSLPADLILFGVHNRVDQWPHALTICRVWLHEIDHVESVCLILLCILYPKVIPLAESLCPIIILKV